MKSRLYDAACLALLALALFFLARTILFSAGVFPDFSGVSVTAALVLGGALTVGSLAFRKPSGTRARRVGYFLAHGGVLLLLIGFALYEGWGDCVTAAVPVGGESFYSSIQRDSGELCDLGFNFRVENFAVETYEDGSEKQYSADLSFADPVTLKVEKAGLSVNHTVRRNGWKIYLMNYGDGFVRLLFRRDPGEFVVKTGAAVLIAGCLLSLLAGNAGRKRKEGADDV
ncbi:MAG: cytochrome c biogenesis protein ResB [Eubacteriales bacterium]